MGLLERECCEESSCSTRHEATSSTPCQPSDTLRLLLGLALYPVRRRLHPLEADRLPQTPIPEPHPLLASRLLLLIPPTLLLHVMPLYREVSTEICRHPWLELVNLPR